MIELLNIVEISISDKFKFGVKIEIKAINRLIAVKIILFFNWHRH